MLEAPHPASGLQLVRAGSRGRYRAGTVCYPQAFYSVPVRHSFHTCCNLQLHRLYLHALLSADLANKVHTLLAFSVTKHNNKTTKQLPIVPQLLSKMKSTTLLAQFLAAAGAASAMAVSPDGSSSSTSSETAAPRKIPTSYESAVMARRILALTPLGTLATIFPDNNNNNDDGKKKNPGDKTLENRPAEAAGMPHGLMEYIADCEAAASQDDNGNPTMLAINVETSFKNIAAGSNVSLAVQWTPPHPPHRHRRGRRGGGGQHHGHKDDHHDVNGPRPLPYSAAALPRFSLLGYVEQIEGGDDLNKGQTGARLASCFTKTHPDARFWLPGSRVHESHFVRLVVQQIYWIGGFGDRAYIGWIPLEEWQKVKREDWEAIRLPGEEHEHKKHEEEKEEQVVLNEDL